MTRFGKAKQLLVLTLGIAAVSGCRQYDMRGPCQVRIDEVDEYRAVWVATAYNLDWPSSPRDRDMQQQIEQIVQRTYDSNCNVIFLQVRAFADRIHRSNSAHPEPWAASVGGRDPGFDPLRYWISVCHDKGIKIHFWVNPFRAYENRFPATEPKYKSYKDPYTGWTYLDSKEQDTRDYVLSVIDELLEIDDGLIFDHYYSPPPYPLRMKMAASSRPETEKRTVQKKKHTPQPRQAHLDQFMKDVYDHAHTKRKKFGFSPDPDDPNVQLWAQDRLDYVVPELYDAIGTGHAFQVALDPWLDSTIPAQVIVGLNSIKVHPDQGNWPAGEIFAQIRKTRDYTHNNKKAVGQAHYRQFVFRDLPSGTPPGHDLYPQIIRSSGINDRYTTRVGLP